MIPLSLSAHITIEPIIIVVNAYIIMIDAVSIVLSLLISMLSSSLSSLLFFQLYRWAWTGGVCREGHHSSASHAIWFVGAMWP